MFKIGLYKMIPCSIIFIIILQVNTISGQISQISTSQHPVMTRYDDMYNSQPKVPNISSPFPQDTFIQQKNEAILREVEEYLKCNSITLPVCSTTPISEYFHSARNEILEMLEGKRNLSLKRAVFVTENAFFQNRMKYEDFDTAIKNLKYICLLKLQEEKLDINDDMAKLMMIFRVMSEIIKVKEPSTEKIIVHYPMKYDFDDYSAQNKTSNYMVSKLLTNNAGQCHSMPLLFLILAEEMDVEAFWCFSPNHSFIKFKDKKNRWYNIELTQGALVTDDFYMNSGFIKSKAIQNGIYLNPLSARQTIAHLLNDLSFYYIPHYGYDHFVEENSNLVLQYAPFDLTAYNIYANVCTAQAMHAINECGRPPKEQLAEYPQAYSLYKRMLKSYEKIDSLGYEEMPVEMYHKWLNQIDKEKVLPENQSLPIIQFKK